MPGHLETILLLPWSFRVLPRCQNGPERAKWRHEAPQMANVRKYQGLAAEGVTLQNSFNERKMYFTVLNCIECFLANGKIYKKTIELMTIEY